MNNILIIVIILNLFIVNITILNIIEHLNNIIIYLNYNIPQIENNNTKKCYLNCHNEINTIKYFYENISQFKNMYYFSPLKIEQLNNNTCQILYIKLPHYKKQNSYKDIRQFTMDYYIQNSTCYWYITDLSPSLI